MSLFQLGDAPIVRGTITLPRTGRWQADIELESAPPGEGSPVTLRGPGIELVGHAGRVGSFHGAHRVRAVGGTGGLTQELPAASYRNMPVGLLLEEILGPAGERLSSLVGASVTTRTVPSWVRPAGLAGAALAALAELVGVTWRLLPDGSVWLGDDSWASASVGGEVFDADPITRGVSVALDSAALLPGQTWRGFKVESITHTITGTGFRSAIEVQRVGPAPGSSSLAQIIRGVMREFENARERPAKVITQNADGTLELKPEDERWPGMSKVPIRYGLPGVSAKIKAGARVIFTFEGDDTTRPIVVGWDNADVEKVEIDAAIVDLRPGTGRSIACNGDMVMIPSKVPIPVQLFSDPAGAIPLIATSSSGPVPITPAPVFMRFGTAPGGFMMAGQVVSVSPNKS